MGLAGTKNKRRLGNDPNNTKWSRNTDSFGQRMLRSQGWEPGQYLGAKDAAHAEWHSEASAAHIRVVLKDDMLGLGAKRNNGDECTGLDAFQHLLGRLNGKSDEVLESEQRERDNLKLNLYLDRKVGMIRFVPGGFLLGDVVKEKLDDDTTPDASDSAARDGSKDSTETEESTEAEQPTEKKSKKRKAERDADRDEEKARKKEKKSKRRKTDSEAETDGEDAKEKRKKKKKDKKDKKAKKRNTESDDDEIEQSASSKSSSKRKRDKERATDESTDGIDVSVEDAKKSKKEKKKAKKEKKEKRRKEKSAAESGSESDDEDTSREKKRRKDEDSTQAESGISTPSGSGYSTPVTTSTRYLARSRFIAQKKLAFRDSAALNQIFMIKS